MSSESMPYRHHLMMEVFNSNCMTLLSTQYLEFRSRNISHKKINGTLPRPLSALEQDIRVTSASKTWKHLWKDTGICAVCMAPYSVSDEVQGCYGCYATVHHHCLMEDWRADRFPICCACGEVAPEPLPPLPPPDEDPPGEDDRPNTIPLGPEAREPEVSDGFLEQLQESGSTPCELHGMDHLSYDLTCEHCKRALGPCIGI